MDSISHMPSPRSLWNSFIIGSTFLIVILECLNNSWWCFSSSFSNFEDRRRISLKSCSILFKIRGSSLMPSSHNCFRLWEFFSTIRSKFKSLLNFLSGIHLFKYYSFSVCSYHSPNLTGASFNILLSARDLFVSVVSKSPNVSSFIS